MDPKLTTMCKEHFRVSLAKVSYSSLFQMEICCGMLPSSTICLKSNWNRFHWITTWKAPCTKMIPGAHGPLLGAEGPFRPCTTRPILIFSDNDSKLPASQKLLLALAPFCRASSVWTALPCWGPSEDTSSPASPRGWVTLRAVSHSCLWLLAAHTAQRVLEKITLVRPPGTPWGGTASGFLPTPFKGVITPGWPP